MPAETCVMGLFTDDGRAAAAVDALRDTSWKLLRVHSPFPSARLFEAARVKKSMVGYFTLIGGIIGFFSGFGLAVYTAGQWSLIVSGKPIMAWIPFVIAGFEFTILFSVFGNVLGFLVLSRLPRLRNVEHYDPRCSGGHFGVLASCFQKDAENLADFFRQRGGEARIMEPVKP